MRTTAESAVAEWGKWQIKKQHFLVSSKKENCVPDAQWLWSAATSLTGGDNAGVSFLSLPFSGGGSDDLSFFLLSFHFHCTGAACPLSSFVFFPQNCITVISSFVRCFHALVVSSCAHALCLSVINLCLCSPWPIHSWEVYWSWFSEYTAFSGWIPRLCYHVKQLFLQ